MSSMVQISDTDSVPSIKMAFVDVEKTNIAPTSILVDLYIYVVDLSLSCTDLGDRDGQDVTSNPGLVAVLCIFGIVVAVVVVVVIVKAVRSRRPQFERLDDVPMVSLKFRVVVLNHSYGPSTKVFLHFLLAVRFWHRTHTHIYIYISAVKRLIAIKIKVWD